VKTERFPDAHKTALAASPGRGVDFGIDALFLSHGALSLVAVGPSLFVAGLFMLGYLKDARWGATAYNLVHTLAGPILLLAIALLLPAAACIPYALIWLAHMGFDRMLGYGLKYPTFFKDTHLQHV
jgi:hypothetical protein